MKITTYSILAELEFSFCLIVHAGVDVQEVTNRQLNAINNLDSVKLEIGDHGNNKQTIKLEHTNCKLSSCTPFASTNDCSDHELLCNLVFSFYLVVYEGEEVESAINHLMKAINHNHFANLLLADGEGNSQTIKIHRIIDCEDLDCNVAYRGNVD